MTETATKTVAPKRKAATSPEKRATQLQALTAAREYFAESKKFGDMVAPMDSLDVSVPGYVSTRSLAVDWVAGNGGLPMGRIVDASGDEGTGKSSIADMAMAEIQSRDGHAYLWDTENARDDRYQTRLGIQRARANLITAHTMEDGFETMIEILSWHIEHDRDRLGIIVWDTPAGTPTRAEADPEKTAERFGPAKVIRGYLRQVNQLLQQTKWILFVVNQTYQGTSPGGQTFKAVYGGGGIPFYSSVRMSLSHVSPQWRTDGEKAQGFPPIGHTVWLKTTKNRVAAPHRSKKLCLHYGYGIDNDHEVFQTLLEYGAIQQKGAWYSFAIETLAAKYPKSWQRNYWGFKAMQAEYGASFWDDCLALYREAMADLDRRFGMEGTCKDGP